MYSLITSISLAILLTGCFSQEVPAPVDNSNEAFGVWNTLKPRYDQNQSLAGLTFEWEYFMIHDSAGQFTGSLGYVIADPHQRLVGWMPTGVNVAMAGVFNGGAPQADFVNFAYAESQLSQTEKAVDSQNLQGDFASIYPVISPAEAFIARGKTNLFEWDLVISQDWEDRDYVKYEPVPSFDAAFAWDIGPLSNEEWTVNMEWPRTRVVGTIIDRSTGVTYQIDGHGYRENSYGRYAFVSDGWDFGVVSDEDTGVQWAWQSYHRSSLMDFVDVSFYDNAVLRSYKFKANEKQLSWFHSNWQYSAEARQCIPMDATIISENEEYKITVQMDNSQQVPMLSDITPMTSKYVINVLFPQYSGEIRRVADDSLVTTFGGLGGGEFAVPRRSESSEAATQEQCDAYGKQFTRNLL